MPWLFHRLASSNELRTVDSFGRFTTEQDEQKIIQSRDQSRGKEGNSQTKARVSGRTFLYRNNTVCILIISVQFTKHIYCLGTHQSVGDLKGIDLPCSLVGRAPLAIESSAVHGPAE